MDYPLVSIIVPCYNQAQYLPETLDSILVQTYSNWECVIVNDGSPDNTEEIAKKYCEKDCRFKYLEQENNGVATARNNGIKISNGKYILPLDGDDIIAPTYCEKAVTHFQNYPETKLVYCKAETFGDQNEPWDLPSYSFEKLIWNNCIFNSALYKREDYDNTVGYNPNMVNGLEDWDFWLSLLSPNSKVYRIDDFLFRYRIKNSSRNHNLNSVNIELKQLYKNHQDIYAPYAENIITFWNEYMELRIDYEKIKNQLLLYKKTFTYRIGRLLLKPFSILRKLIRTIN